MSALAGRGPVLHARARRLPLAAATVLAVAALTATAGLLSTALEPDLRPDVLISVVAFVPVVVAMVVSVTLSGADVDLDLTSPRLSARGRGLRAAVTVALVCLVLGGAAATATAGVDPLAVVRNTVGLVGIVLLAVTLVPPVVAWLPAFLYGGFTVLITPRPPPPSSAWWSFLVQPGTGGVSWAVVGALLVVGAVAYAVRGPRRGA